MTDDAALAAIGTALRAAGLTVPMLAAWAGTAQLPLLGAGLVRLRTPEPTPAAVALVLFVAGGEVPRDRVAKLVAIAALVDAGLVTVAGDHVRATVAILPHAQALLVCDRADAAAGPELVCWPDDSSFHLAKAIPRTSPPRWIDLACGSAVAQLVRPQLAATRLASDLNPRAIRYAQLGAGLSGIPLVTSVADLAAEGVRAELVTCNAPIPAAFPVASPHLPMWRTTSADFFRRLFEEAIPQRLVEHPDSLVVVHARRDQLDPSRLTGERVRVTYTPEGVAPGFAILWWRPFAEAVTADSHRTLTTARPHVDADDREAALAGRIA